MAVFSIDDSPLRFPQHQDILTFAKTSNPDCTTVSDSQGVLAVLTTGSKTVTVRGQTRTFTEQKKPFTDTFSRTVSSGFGQSPGGGVWSNLTGTDSKFSVNGSVGLINMDVSNVSRHCSVLDNNVGDTLATARVSVSKLPVTAASSVALSFNYVDSNNNNRARVTFTPSGAIQLDMEKEVNGTVTALGTTVALGTGFAANDWWRIKVERTGNTVRCRAWKDGTTEPGTWAISVTDTTFMTGRVGFRSLASNGSTAIPYNSMVDDLSVSGTWSVPPVVTHNTWVRTLTVPFSGTWSSGIAAQIQAWKIDTRPDALAYAMMFISNAPVITDPSIGNVQVYGTSQYGPLSSTGLRIEAADWNDYMGINWTYSNGEVRTFPHGSITTTNVMDCSGYVRMVYGRGMNLPMSYSSTFDGLNIPRNSANISTSGPGVILAQGTNAPPALTLLLPGDVLCFDADLTDPVEGTIDHTGIYLGLDSSSNHRFISSRKTVNGPTMSDLGGPSILEGSGTYATRLRMIRRF